MVCAKQCTVAFALPQRQFLWSLELAPEATVADALQAARELARAQGEEGTVPWESDALGIFGEPCRRGDVLRDGDRVEIYRALLHDPKVTRRARVRGR